MINMDFLAPKGFSKLGGGSIRHVRDPVQPIDPEAIKSTLDNLDPFINEVLNTFGVPGAAIGIVVDDQVILTKGYGYRDLERRLPVTENTLFGIGSCTKAFTAFLLAQLVEEGKLSWDDLVVKYLPEFKLKDQYATYHMTLRDLVAHRSGLAPHNVIICNSNFSRSDLLDKLQHLDFSSSFRESFQYNNLLYGIAGIFIEKVLGISWEEAVKERILKPLAMERSNVSIEETKLSEDFSLPYDLQDQQVVKVPFQSYSNIASAVAINTCVADMVKWIRLQLSDGSISGKRIVREEILRDMHTIQMSYGLRHFNSAYEFGYGMGWRIGTYKSHHYVWHGGYMDGFMASVDLLPQKRLGIVLLSNSTAVDEHAHYCINNTIIDGFVRELKDDWVSKFNDNYKAIKLSRELNIKKENSDDPKNLNRLQDYVGTYFHPGYGSIEISLKDSEMIASYGRFTFPLYHQNYDAFFGSPADPVFSQLGFSFSFLRGVSGNIEEVHIPFEPLVAPIIFKKKPSNELLKIDYLKQFVARFEGFWGVVETRINNGRLMASSSKFGSFTLSPEKPCKFLVDDVSGCKVDFSLNSEGKVMEMSLEFAYNIYKFNVK